MPLLISFGGDGGIYAYASHTPFCASLFSRLEPSPTQTSAGRLRFTAMPFRVRIPSVSDNENEDGLSPSSFSLAETVGFEPTVPRRYTAFRVRLVITTSIRLHIRLSQRTDKSDFNIFTGSVQLIISVLRIVRHQALSRKSSFLPLIFPRRYRVSSSRRSVSR